MSRKYFDLFCKKSKDICATGAIHTSYRPFFDSFFIQSACAHVRGRYNSVTCFHSTILCSIYVPQGHGRRRAMTTTALATAAAMGRITVRFRVGGQFQFRRRASLTHSRTHDGDSRKWFDDRCIKLRCTFRKRISGVTIRNYVRNEWMHVGSLTINIVRSCACVYIEFRTT